MKKGDYNRSGINKQALEANLEKLRRDKLCVYLPPSKTCDCKYGKPGEHVRRMSERFSGCPEVRQVLTMVKAMTDKEFNELCKRAKIDAL